MLVTLLVLVIINLLLTAFLIVSLGALLQLTLEIGRGVAKQSELLVSLNTLLLKFTELYRIVTENNDLKFEDISSQLRKYYSERN